jgi:3-oxoacyl-[acyl-carrier protein] reductase
VTLAARSRQEIEQVAAAIRVDGGDAIAVQTDVSQEGDVARMVDAALRHFGQVDVLVNNAAANLPNIDVVDITPEQWRLILDVNLTGPYLCAREVLRHMLPRKTGTIINIASIGGRHGARGRGPYRASKAGLINLTETLAAECIEHGISVNCICPGGVETEMMQQITLGKPGPNLMQPRQIAEIALFLATEESSAITGTAIDAFGLSNPLFR